MQGRHEDGDDDGDRCASYQPILTRYSADRDEETLFYLYVHAHHSHTWCCVLVPLSLSISLCFQ